MSNFEVKAGLAEVEEFTIIGVSTVTLQEDATTDINALWEQFFKESIGQKIPEKEDDVIFAVYSDYEGDHEAPYRLTIGYRSKSTEVPEEMTRVSVKAQNYAVISATGKQPESLIDSWKAIWSSDLNRSFHTDFEVYGPRFFEDGVNEVLVHVGIED